MGKKWDNDEVVKLLAFIQQKKSIEDIANEHERTIGGINSQIRNLAAAYWFNDKKPIEEISRFTGLTPEEIKDVIKRRESGRNSLNTGPATEKTTDKSTPDMRDVVTLLIDIKGLLTTLIEKVNV